MRSIKTLFGIRGRSKEQREQASHPTEPDQPILRTSSTSSRSLNNERRAFDQDYLDAQLLGNDVEHESTNDSARRPRSPEQQPATQSGRSTSQYEVTHSSSKPPRGPAPHNVSEQVSGGSHFANSARHATNRPVESDKTRVSTAARRVPVPTPTPTQTVRSAKESLTRQTSKSTAAIEPENLLAPSQYESSATKLTSSLILEVTSGLPPADGRVRGVKSDAERHSTDATESTRTVSDKQLAQTSASMQTRSVDKSPPISPSSSSFSRSHKRERHSDEQDKWRPYPGTRAKRSADGKKLGRVKSKPEIPDAPSLVSHGLGKLTSQLSSERSKQQMDKSGNGSSAIPHKGDGMPWLDDEDENVDIVVSPLDISVEHGEEAEHGDSQSRVGGRRDVHVVARASASVDENFDVDADFAEQIDAVPRQGTAGALKWSSNRRRVAHNPGLQENKFESAEFDSGVGEFHGAVSEEKSDKNVQGLKLPQAVLSRVVSDPQDPVISGPSSPTSPQNISLPVDVLGAPSSPVSPAVSHIRSDKSTVLSSLSPRTAVGRRNLSFENVDPHHAAAIQSQVNTAYAESLQEEARGHGGGLRRIIELLRQNESNQLAVENIAIAVNVLSENDSVTSDAFGNYGAVEILLHCLVKYEENSTVCGRVVAAIRSIVTGSRRNAKLLEAFDGVHVLTNTAKCTKSQNDPTIAVDALRTLAALMLEPMAGESSDVSKKKSTSSISLGQDVHRKAHESVDTANTEILRWRQAISNVVLALDLHEHREQVQEAGLRALRTLLAKMEPSKLDHAQLVDVIRAAKEAYVLHGDASMDICWQCLGLMCDVDDARDGQFRVELDVQSFFGCLLQVIAATGAETDPAASDAGAQLCARALCATDHIGWRTRERCQNIVKAGAFEAVLEALRVFPDRREILEPACSLGRSIIKSEDCKYLIDVKGHELILNVLGAIVEVTRS